MGAIIATIIPAIELAKPSRAVETVASTPWDQYFLKNMGKNPAMTVVAKAELAQSYMAQETIDFLLYLFI